MSLRSKTLTAALFVSASLTPAVSPQAQTFERFKREMMPQVGKKITVRGVLKAAKLGWLVLSENGGVYIYPRKESITAKMSTLKRFEAKTVRASGILRYFPEPASPPAEIAAVPPEHFFFDVDEVEVTNAGQPDLTHTAASHFAKLALKCVTKEFPNKPDHTINDSADVRGPRTMHPAF